MNSPVMFSNLKVYVKVIIMTVNAFLTVIYVYICQRKVTFLFCFQGQTIKIKVVQDNYTVPVTSVTTFFFFFFLQ